MQATASTRSLWPWAIFGFYLTAVVFLVLFIAWAMHQREDLVSENYYENEIRYQEHLDRLNRSQGLRASEVIGVDAAQQRLVIRLPQTATTKVTGQVDLYRPSDARLDRQWPLTLDATGVQYVDAKTLAGGLWKVRVRWTVAGRDFYCDQPVVLPGKNS